MTKTLKMAQHSLASQLNAAAAPTPGGSMQVSKVNVGAAFDDNTRSRNYEYGSELHVHRCNGK